MTEIILPESFTNKMKTILGEEYTEFNNALNSSSPTSIRLNDGIKVPISGFVDLDLTEDIPWCKSGKYLSERPVFTLDPLFQAGSYYVQEAASMFVEQCINTIKQYGNIDYLLDLCAAPGGKSTHLASLCPDSLLISNEVIRSRVAILAENTAKCGMSNVVLTSSDSSSFARLSEFFDFILVDAPCSGEGMFRKDSGALKEWSPENVKHCAARQLRIVHDVWDSLKPGGFLLYSTCTYNKQENEDTVRYIIENLGAETISVDLSSLSQTGISPSLDSDIEAYRFYPHKTRSEGFFISLMRKHGELKHSNSRKYKKNTFKDFRLDSWIKNCENYILTDNNKTIFMLPEKFAGDIEHIAKYIHVLSSGTEICEIKGAELIPAFNFAHSQFINRNNFITMNIDKTTALKFFKKEPLPVPENITKGYVLVLYNGVSLGWVKNIGSRCNNLLPQNRRIRMTI